MLDTLPRTLPWNRFQVLAPISTDYASRPVREGFNWSECGADAGEWCLIAFRSVLQESADTARLWEQDELAFEEAAALPGFVHYFRGLPNERGECLSFCLWESWEQARASARGRAHTTAMELVRDTFASFRLEFLTVTKSSPTGSFEFTPVVRH
ncbi:MAG: hypothetical protein M3454_07265 [Actinomycetota bacterium]|nr:hypothetical protein [Actinomycetota bacterium]